MLVYIQNMNVWICHCAFYIRALVCLSMFRTTVCNMHTENFGENNFVGVVSIQNDCRIPFDNRYIHMGTEDGVQFLLLQLFLGLSMVLKRQMGSNEPQSYWLWLQLKLHQPNEHYYDRRFDRLRLLMVSVVVERPDLKKKKHWWWFISKKKNIKTNFYRIEIVISMQLSICHAWWYSWRCRWWWSGLNLKKTHIWTMIHFEKFVKTIFVPDWNDLFHEIANLACLVV